MRLKTKLRRLGLLAGIPLLLILGTTVIAQPVAAEPTVQAKQTRIPRFFYDNNAYTGNFRESENFVVRWGDAVDVVAWGRQNGYSDYPAFVLNHMETVVWDYYVEQNGWVDPNSFSPAKDYKINLYLCGSWRNGFLPPANWAGADDIGVGHICLPYNKIWDKWVESHEFNHVLQVYACAINRAAGNGGGFGYGNRYSGRFWEAHANYMARMQRPEVVTGSGYYGRHHYRWLDQMTYYGDWMLLNKIRDQYGPDAVDRLWYDARQGEHPIDTIKRTLTPTHAQFADLIGDYARRNVVYDYADGRAIRGDLWRNNAQYRPLYTVSLETVNQSAGDYRIASRAAPQQYGYNIVALNPAQSGGQVSVRLQGQGNAGTYADWRFSLVAVRPDFSVRYSPQFSSGATANFSLQPGETHMLLVVTATPTTHINYAEGAAIASYPYLVNIRGATPAPGTANP